ncbi:MAG: polysaccharide biosynthesis tyrosine autokinase [Caldilineaceae bacterium]|nr:polysaccharide biosynthesis tyrosine autokinase [Caldilineaceae bacterium]
MDTLSREIERTELRLTELDARTRTAQEEVEYGRLTNALTQYQSSYANVLQSYETLRLAEIQSIDNIVVMEQAAVPRTPVRPRVLVNTLLAVVVGSMLALGTIFLIEYLDDRVRTPDDLRRIADIPSLGAIAKIPPKVEARPGLDGVVALAEPRSPVVEAYRRLRTNLQFYNLDAGVQSIVVTSANMGEGKTTTAANLAVVLAQSGETVILVDADLRKPTLHHRFDVPRKPGLSETLLAPAPVNLTRQVRDVPNLRVLTCGERVPNPSEVLSSKRMQQLVDDLKTQANIIIFDSPPLLAVTDAEIVGRYTDGLLLVVDTQKTTGAAVHRALESVAQVNVPVMGAMLNRISNTARGYYYYYSNNYYYRADDDGDDGDGAAGAQGASRPAQGDETLTPRLSYSVGHTPTGDQSVGD